MNACLFGTTVYQNRKYERSRFFGCVRDFDDHIWFLLTLTLKVRIDKLTSVFYASVKFIESEFRHKIINLRSYPPSFQKNNCLIAGYKIIKVLKWIYRLLWQCYADRPWITDINLLFTKTNCQIICSRLLTHILNCICPLIDQRAGEKVCGVV